MPSLSFTSHPSIFVTSVGGIAVGITLLLLPWKSMSLSNTSHHPLITKQFKLASGEGNCEVVNNFQEVSKDLSLTSSHISISCKNRGIKEADDHPLENTWSALFPISFFKNYDDKLIIKTETDVLELGKDFLGKTFITKFKSDWFTGNGEIIGVWDYSENKHGGKLVHTVEVIDRDYEKRIYFLQDFVN